MYYHSRQFSDITKALSERITKTVLYLLAVSAVISQRDGRYLVSWIRSEQVENMGLDR